jgi:hypothetical protein
MNRTGMAAAAALWGGVLIAAGGMAPAYAANECGGLVFRDKNGEVREIRTQEDGKVFVNGGRTWERYEDVRSLVASGEFERKKFIYLAKGDPGDRGVMVAKIRDQAAGQVSPERYRVHLKRGQVEALSPQMCKGVLKKEWAARKEFDDWVRGTSYDKYHDHGFERSGGILAWLLPRSDRAKNEQEFGKDVRKIKEFHILYQRRKAAREACALTDDIGNGNRAKFSFDESVSGRRGRLYSKVNVFKSAYAGEKMQLRQVYMSAYKLGEDGAACIPFEMKITKSSVLQIHDLER